MLSCARNFRPIIPRTIQACYSKKVAFFTDNSRSYSKSPDEKDITIGGLAKALGKFREIEKSDVIEVKQAGEQNSFLHLLRHSEFVQMGDPAGKIVIGKIFQVVNTDLYIDFGGKFYCVCRKPKRNSE